MINVNFEAVGLKWGIFLILQICDMIQHRKNKIECLGNAASLIG